MPLPLDDPRWSELHGGYNGTSDVVAWLKEAQQAEGLSPERLGDLINEVQHQGGTSTAMYAVAGHLIEFARRASPERALDLFIQAGLIYAESARSNAVPCPPFLRVEFDALASEGARLLAPLLPAATDFDNFKYAVAALAGFTGHHAFGRLLMGLDFYKGQFYHSSLEKPFPPEAS
jgi:hypothetical protein